jgi:hypothetical protein
MSDALARLSQSWKLPVSELQSYHRALRAADAIPAQSRGRGVVHVGEDALLRFVLAYCSSRQANLSPARLDLTLTARRHSNKLQQYKDSRSKLPSFFIANNPYEFLAGAVAYFRPYLNSNRAEREELPILVFQFDLTYPLLEVLHYRWVERSAKLPEIFFTANTPSTDDDEANFQETRSFRTATLFTLAEILAN